MAPFFYAYFLHIKDYSSSHSKLPEEGTKRLN